MINLNQTLNALDKLGYHSFSFDGSAHSTKVTCHLYTSQSSEAAISAPGRYGLDALRNALKLVRARR